MVEEAPTYVVKSIPRADFSNVKIGKPAHGLTNNFEPLLSGVREGSLPETKIKELLSTLGITMKDNSLEYRENGLVRFIITN